MIMQFLLLICLYSSGYIYSDKLELDIYYTYMDSDMGNKKSKVEVFKNKLTYLMKNRNVNEREFICSTSVALKEIEPDVKLWPERLIADSPDGHFTPLMVALSLFGHKEAIEAFKSLFYEKSIHQRTKNFISDVLLNSPVSWYPLCSNMLNDTRHLYRVMRFRLYNLGFIKLLETHPQPETKDSVIQLICKYLNQEPNHELLLKADNLLIHLAGDEYKYSEERINFLKRKLKSDIMQKYLKEYGYLMIKYNEILKVIEETLKERQLHSSEYFKSCFSETDK